VHLNLRHLLVVLSIALSVGTSAGNWESGSFDNDDATDWVAMCTQSNGAGAVSKTLEMALKPVYLAASEASQTIAAAEVVTAARGKASQKLLKALGVWLQGQSKKEIAGLAPIASRAVERILKGKGSELQDLWKESKSYESWHGQMLDFAERLR
jgi:Domain of unknown function (DUF4259)